MKKKNIKYYIIGVFILLFILFFLFITPQQTALPTNTTAGITGFTGYGGGGGGGGSSSSGSSGSSGSAPSVPSLPTGGFSFPSWSFPSFDFPSFSFPSMPSMPSFGGFGTPSTPEPTTPTSRLTPDVRITSECSRNSDCHKCANANYDTCSSGVCVCSAPVVEPVRTIIEPVYTPTCTDTDSTRGISDGLNYYTAGTCIDGTAVGAKSDYCYRGVLEEYSCGSKCIVTEFDCSTLGRGYTCSDGACVFIP